MNHAQAALEIDKLMQWADTPEKAEALRRALDKTLPVDKRDQLNAAEADMTETINELLEIFGSSEGTVRMSPPDWVRLSVFQTASEFHSGASRTCLHSPSGDHPEPVFAVAWKLGLVVCRQCTYLLTAVGNEDTRCDICGRLTTGPDNADGIFLNATQSGPLMFQWGACMDCNDVPEELRLERIKNIGCTTKNIRPDGNRAARRRRKVTR